MGHEMNGEAPPKSPPMARKKSGGKLKVALLDDTMVAFEIEARSPGDVLIKLVNKHLNLEEAEFFGLQITGEENKDPNELWLDGQKPINKQVKDISNAVFKFRVLFYTPDPNTLQEYTRYLFTLQVRRDLLDGRLHCSEDTGALMASYIVQGELGNYDENNHKEGYLAGFQFVPNQTDEVERMIVRYHQSHTGMSAIDADQKMLDIARQLDMYGITLHAAHDRDGAHIHLAVYHAGILVFQNRTKINSFSWGVIRKISFKKKKFLIKLIEQPNCPGGKSTVVFSLANRNTSKGFWKICLNHHVFFRHQTVKSQLKPSRFKRGSSYRYSGRTKKEIAEVAATKFRQQELPSESSDSKDCGDEGGPSYSTPIHALHRQVLDMDEGSFSVYADDNTQHDKQQVIKMEYQETPPSYTEVVNNSSAPTNEFALDIDVNSFTVASHAEEKTQENNNEVFLASAEENVEEGSDTEDMMQQTLSDQTEADAQRDADETDAQLREKLQGLYLQQPALSTNQHASYDSDSDASAMTVDDEESTFGDDLSLPRSSSSSVSSISSAHKHTYLLKLKTSGKVYEMAKEILLTERTYVKDLEILTVSFRSVVEQGLLPERTMRLLFDNIDPLYDFHCSLLAELEERLALWENASSVESTRDSHQKIGDIMHKNMRQIKLYTSYVQKHGEVLLELEAQTKRSKEFENAYKEFELTKGCYLSLNSFLLKPVQRLLYYKNILARLTKEYGKLHADSIDAKVAYEEVVDAFHQVQPSMRVLENLHKLVELERDLVGVDGLVCTGREFIREGCLHKVCRKGPQPRMFFLFSDILLYTSQGVTAANQFRARTQIPLYKIKVEEGGLEWHGLYAFTITPEGESPFIVAASSPEERQKWLHDLRTAIKDSIEKNICKTCCGKKGEILAKTADETSCPSCKQDIARIATIPSDQRISHLNTVYPRPPAIRRRQTGADDDSDDDEGVYDPSGATTLERRHAHSRTISTRRVCWHRNTSISLHDYTLSIQNSLSGILFRKYKNSNKWQRLWVVFTNFCLYFFKNYEDEAPLASLPLIGYSLSKPAETEIHDDLAFKLQFKTHIYFFRAETQYSYDRWREAIGIATKDNTSKPRASRMASLS